jgi:hypothetical protein
LGSDNGRLSDIILSNADVGTIGIKLRNRSMTTIGHVFIPLDREHDGTLPTGDDQAHFESLSVPLVLWQPFEQCLSDHPSELSDGEIDREEKFWFEAAHVNAMIAVVEAEAVTHSIVFRISQSP